MTNQPEPGGHYPSESRARHSWWWRLERKDGGPTQESQRFPSQADAETWLGEVWRDLLEQGTDEVSLFEDDHAIYGPMSLHQA